MMGNYSSYQSPFSWRYGSAEMRRVWSEENKRLLWRKLWVVMAETQVEWGLVTPEQVQDLKDHAGEIDIPRALEIEEKLHHDLMAEIKVYASQCKTGGGIIHLGATSMDIKDNAEALQIKEGLALVTQELTDFLGGMADNHRAICRVTCHGVYPSAAGRTNDPRIQTRKYRAGSAGGLAGGQQDQR